MRTIEVGNVKLQYSKANSSNIKRIIQIIELNWFLFNDYKDKIISIDEIEESFSNDTIHITDFNLFFDMLLKKKLEDDCIIRDLKEPNLLPAIYIQLLIKNEKEETVISPNKILTDDLLWFYIACNFFDIKNQFEGLSTFLKYRINKDQLYNWLKETQRFNTYNYLLEIASNYFKKHDILLFNNFDKFLSDLTAKITVSNLLSQNNTKFDSPKITKEDFENLFYDFLKIIKAPNTWKELYCDLKRQNRILFKKDYKGISKCYKDNDGIYKIKVISDGTIKDFITFVHEFAHYISLQTGVSQFFLSEFPSIYYENLAALYLIQIGYNEDVIKAAIKYRNQNNYDIYNSLFGLLRDIFKYNKNGPILKEEKIKLHKKRMEANNQLKLELLKTFEDKGIPITNNDFFKPDNLNIEKLANDECDENILNFIKNGLLVLNGYQYLVGSYLSDKLLEKNFDEEILSKMINITTNLSQFNLDELVNYLELEDSIDIKKNKTKKLTKNNPKV